MFICSFKLNKARALSGVAAICLALTLVFLIAPSQNESTVLKYEAKNQQEMVDFLESVGYTVTPEAIMTETVTIPETFDQKYTEYNEKQKPAGFDLEKFAGKTVQKYTFKVLNFDESKTEVVANLLVCDGQIIGGDVSATELGGFCKGLVEDKSEEDKE